MKYITRDEGRPKKRLLRGSAWGKEMGFYSIGAGDDIKVGNR